MKNVHRYTNQTLTSKTRKYSAVCFLTANYSLRTHFKVHKFSTYE